MNRMGEELKVFDLFAKRPVEYIRIFSSGDNSYACNKGAKELHKENKDYHLIIKQNGVVERGISIESFTDNEKSIDVCYIGGKVGVDNLSLIQYRALFSMCKLLRVTNNIHMDKIWFKESTAINEKIFKFELRHYDR